MNKSHHLPARELSLDDSWDVIVVGGGPTGCKGDGLGQMQPGTHCFIPSNVEEYAYKNGPDLGW